MFSRWLNLNLRTRLTAMLCVTVSVALALVFIVVAFIVREQALGRRFSELESNIKRIAHEWSSPDALREVKEDFPGLDVAIYQANGQLIASTTKHSIDMSIGRRKRGDTLSYGLVRGDFVIVGVSSWSETEKGLRQLAAVLFLLWIPLVALVAAAAWYGGGLVMRPVSELVASAERLSEKETGRYLETSDGAEFAKLAQSLNQLIERIRRSAALQEQFAADAAHELRTPLALLRTRIEINLQKERTPEEHVVAQRAMLRQIERLSSITEALLSTARQQARPSQPEDFGKAVREAAKDWLELAQRPSKLLEMKIEECASMLSPEEIGLIVRNLLDNAARYSPSDSSIELKVACAEGVIALSVRDYGPGLKEEDMKLAFERFYRADEGRDRERGGAGIGLAIVKRIVEWHGGSVAFEPVDIGAMVLLRVPSTA